MYKKNNVISFDQLNQYFQTNVLTTNAFCCQHENECASSHLKEHSQESTRRFYKGQLPHIGKYYDLSAQGKPFRIMVVGQEYGHAPSLVDFASRYDMLMDSAEIGYKARNPHMKGTSSLLRLLHGLPLGVDHAEEFIQVGAEPVHLFDTFALANYLLCSAVEDQSARGQATGIMKKNCRVHFVATLEVLQPTILIIQGKGFWDYPIKDVFEGCLEQIDDALYQASFNGQPMLIGVFAHPSAPAYGFWGNSVASKYLVNIVQPTVEKIREILLGESVYA